MPGKFPTEPCLITVKAKLNRTALPASMAKLAQPPRLTATGVDDIRNALSAHRCAKSLGIIEAREVYVCKVLANPNMQLPNTENRSRNVENAVASVKL